MMVPHAAEARTAARNVAVSYGFRGMRALSVLVLTPYLFRRLGLEDFGLYGVVVTLAAILNLVERGFTAGLTKTVAERLACGERAALDEEIGVGSTLMAAVAALSCLVAVPLILLAGGVIAAEGAAAFEVGALVLTVTMVIRFPLFAHGAALLGFQRFDLFAAAEGLGVAVLVAGSIAAVESGGGVLGLAVAYAASLLVSAVAFTILLRRLDPSLDLRPRRGDPGMRRRVAGFGGLALFAESMQFVAQQVDALVVAVIRGAAAAAPLVAALRLVGPLNLLVLPLVDLLLPMVADLRARGAEEEIRRRFVLATRATLQITLPVSVGLALFADEVVNLLFGEGAPPVTASILVVLMVVQVTTYGSLPAGKVLLAAGRVRALAMMASVEGLTNLALSVVLVIRYGAIGAVVATLATSAVIVLLRVPLACRETACPGLRMTTQAIAPAVAATLPSVLVMLASLAAVESPIARVALGLGGGWSVAAVIAGRQVGLRRLRAMVAFRGSPALR